mgnify:CR=1 FL=1
MCCKSEPPPIAGLPRPCQTRLGILSSAVEGLLLDNYLLGQELGAGGMGRVHRATVEAAAGDLPAGTTVAVKVIHSHLLAERGFFKRFVVEAEVGRRIDHPNVVRTLDADAVEVDGSVYHFLVMEYVEGQTLRSLLHELGRLPESLVRHVAREVAQGLDAIHAAGAVHRDLKPDNVLITPDHQVKVMDLGVARLSDAVVRLSMTAGFVGSLAYAAPEQLEAKETDARTDLYALGLVLYELLSGRHPFPGNDPVTLMNQQLRADPPHLSEIHPGVTPFLEELVHVLLSKDPRKRLTSARELLDVLAHGEESDWWRTRAPGGAASPEATRQRPRMRVHRDTAVYGREGDVERLLDAFTPAARGEGRVVLVEGEAGIGKSRLVDELVRRLERRGEDFHFLFGSYPPGGAATAAGAFTAAYRTHFGEGVTADALAPYLARTPLLVPFLCAVLQGESLPRADDAARGSVQTAFVETARSLAAERPVVLLIDDLHFAPDEGKAMFAALAAACADMPVLLVGTARPGLPARWIADLERLPHLQRLPLQRLGAKDLAQLLVDAFRSERVAEDLSFLIARKSDGNPFFVFEIVRGLQESNVLTRRPDGSWVMACEIEDIRIPSSVLDLIHARLDVLNQEEQELLDVAACCGFEVDPLLVAAAMGTPEIAALKLFGRVERHHGLLVTNGRRYVFDHHQIQEAIYGGMPPLLRERYHEKLAEALEARGEASGEDARVELCTHWLHSPHPARALAYLDRALERLAATYRNAALCRIAERALGHQALLTGPDRVGVLLRLRRALDMLGRRGEERRILDEALALAREGAEGELLARVLAEDGGHLERTGHRERAVSRLQEAVRLARQADAPATEANVSRVLGTTLVYLGRYDEARRESQTALRLYQQLGDPWGEAAATANLGLVQWFSGYSASALSCFERELEFFKEAADPRSEAIARANLGFLLSDLGRHAAGRKRLDAALEIVRRLGDRFLEAFLLDWLAQVSYRSGEPAAARDLVGRSLAIRRSILDRARVAESLVTLGLVEAAAGNRPEALRALEESIRLAEATRSGAVLCRATAHRSALHGDVTPALGALAAHERALRYAARIEVRHALWKATGDPAHLHEARRRLEHLRAHAPGAMRRTLVEYVPLHRDIVAAGERLDTAEEAPEPAPPSP